MPTSPSFQLTLLRQNPVCYPLSKGETSFGRSAGCDVRIYDSAVSNVHAKLFLPGVGPEHLQALDEEEQEARLVVLSPNNVKVDDKTVRQSESVALKDAAVIDILGRKFQFNVCHQHKQPLLDTPRTSHNSANHKVRQSMVQRAVLETPVRPSLDDYKEQIEEADLMQWSDDEDQVSVQNRRREASNSEESDPDDENSRQQLCISPRTSQPGPVEETSDEEVEHSLLIPASPTPCPPQLPESPSRPQMQHNKSSPSVEAAQAAMMTPKQPVRAQSYPSPTAGSANNNRSGASVQRRKSLLEKVLIKSAVKAASHRRLSQQQQQQKHKSSSDCVSDSEGSSDSDLSDPDDIDDEDNDEVEEKPAPPAPSLQLDHSAQNYSAAEFEQFFVSSSSDGDDDSDSEDHEADVANASVFSSEDDEEGMSESDVAANQTILPQSTKDLTGLIDPELLTIDSTLNLSPSSSSNLPVASEAAEKPTTDTADETRVTEAELQTPTRRQTIKMSNTQSRTRGEQKSPTLMNNAQSTENQPSSSPSSERITEVSQAPSSARAKRAARRSSGMPASPAVKSPTRGQRRRSSSDGQPAALAQEDLQPESSPAQGSVPSTERSTNHNEGPEVIGADHPTETVADEETHQTLHREEKEQLAESIPSDLAEFRREMALEASGIAVPTPEEHQSNTTDVFSTPQRQMPKAPRKSALKNPSRPTSPNDTPAPPSLKRKVSFSGTTEYKTIAGIHDEEYKREQREMCFVGEVKRRRTSARISHAHDDKDDQGSASSSMPTPSAVPKSSSSTPSKPLAEGHQQTTQTEPSDLLSHSLTTGESGVHQTARTPVKSPSKARRVPTKTPPAAVRQAHYDLQLQTATRGDAPDKQPTLPKPGRSVSPAKRSKAEAQQNMAQLLASPAPKLNHTVFHSPAKVMTEPSPSLPVQQPESVAADGHSTIEGVRAQLQSFRDRQSLSPFKAPMIHLSPATFGLSEPPAQAPPSPSPSSQGKNASEVKTEDNVKPPSTASFTPFLSGVKHMLQLHQAPKTPSFAGLSSMFKEPSLKYETVDWSSHLDPSLFKSPAKVTGTAQTDGSSKGRQSQDSKDEQPCNVSDATAQKPSGIPSMRAKRSTGKSTEAATPQTGGTARRTTRAATGSLKSRVPFKPDTASATSRMGTASAPLRTRATPSVDGRKPPASAKSRSASTTASSQAKARSATSKPASQALASAPPPRRELNKENARQSASRSAATTRRQAASAGTRL